MNNELFKTLEINELYDFYKNVLTDKQKEYFELYFIEDLTLQEIADEFNISRSAVSDSLNKTVKVLHDLEDKLKIKHTHDNIRKKIEKYKINKNIDNFINEIEEEL